MTKDEALKMAIETIRNFKLIDYDMAEKAINACKEALINKEWQGLTDDEVNSIYVEVQTIQNLYRIIETKLKEKNT